MSTPAPLDSVLDLVPALAGKARTTSVLPGGLTNANHKVETADGSYVVRRWNTDSGLLAIDRDNEYENSGRAAAAGVGAPVVAYLPEHCTMVLGFIAGQTLTAADLRRGDRLERVAQSCRTLHSAERFRDDFDMFAVRLRYEAICRERNFPIPDGYDTFESHAEAIADALSVRAEGTVPCNNDLLAENFIDTGDRLCLIDYEYSGNNDACFELGNLWSESDLAPSQLEELVTAYYGRVLRHKIARARLWGLMSKYGWMLWAAIQSGVSEIEFDFWAWGMEKYDRAVAEFEGPEFELWLDEARRAD